jgi:quinol monooxygenase YgiN
MHAWGSHRFCIQMFESIKAALSNEHPASFCSTEFKILIMNNTTRIGIYVSVTVLSETKEKFMTNLVDIVYMARRIKGCLRYQWFINPDDSNNYIIFGEFDTEENFSLYRKSDVVQNIGKVLLPLLKEKPNFKHFRTQLFEKG